MEATEYCDLMMKPTRKPTMTLSEKLRAARRAPEIFDIPGLLEEAASTLDELSAGLKDLSRDVAKLGCPANYNGPSMVDATGAMKTAEEI